MVQSKLPGTSAPIADEPRLIDYLRMVAHRRWLILGATGSCAVLALLTTLMLPKEYRSSATVIVVSPKLADGTPAPAVPMGTYRGLLQNPSVIAQAIADLGLNKPPHSLDAQTFATSSVEIEEVPATALLVVHVQMRDPALAAQIANRIVDAAVKLNQRLSQEESLSASADIRSQVGQARTKLDEAERQLVDFRSTAQIDLRKRDIEALLKERQNLLPLTVEIAGERARLDRAGKELASRQQILDVRRVSKDQGSLLTSSMDQAHRTAQRDNRTGDGAGAVSDSRAGLEAQSEFINPVYEALEFQVATSRTRLAALESRRLELVGKRKLEAPHFAQLSELYQRESQQARLELELDLSRKTYQDLSNRYDQARAQVARTSQLQVVGSATPATRPSSPRIVRTVVATTCLAFMASLLLAFLIEYVSVVRLAEERSTS